MKKHRRAVRTAATDILIVLIIALITNETATAQADPPTQARPHFSHTTIFVTDLAKSTAFYKNVLLLEQIPEPFHDNKHNWFKITEHGQLHVVLGAKAITPHDINIHLAFSVLSLQAFMKHLDEQHIKYGNWTGDKKPQERPDHVLQIYLQDPDGYWIEVNDDRF